MDCAEVKGQIPAEEQLEPLVILEEGDELDDFTHISARGKGVLRVKKENMEDMIKGSSEGSTDSENDVEVESQQKEGLEYINQKIEGVTETEENPEVKRVQTRPGLVMGKAEEETEGLKTKAVPKEESLADSQPSAKLRPRDRLSPEDAQQKVLLNKNSLLMHSDLCLKKQWEISRAHCSMYKRLILQTNINPSNKPCELL